MASLNNIKPGQVLHDYHRNGHHEGHWTVKILKVDLEKRKAFCSWNTNPPRWWSEMQLKRLRVNPKIKKVE